MVQTVQPRQADGVPSQEKNERLPVLEGIRKYAGNHVLLIGRPGSGKSTALVRLLLKEVKALTDSDLYVRMAAASALGRLNSKAAVSGLLRALADPHLAVRRSAVDALGQQ